MCKYIIYFLFLKANNDISSKNMPKITILAFFIHFVKIFRPQLVDKPLMNDNRSH